MTSPFWTGREGELRRLWGQDYTLEALGAHFGCSAQSVGDACRRLGLRRRRGWQPPRRRTPVDKADAVPETPKDKLATRIRAMREAGILRACDFWTLKRDIALAETAGGYAALAGLAARWKVAQGRLLARWHLMRGHLGGIHAKP